MENWTKNFKNFQDCEINHTVERIEYRLYNYSDLKGVGYDRNKYFAI